MKEKIYTIPVTEAFCQNCECPLCVLEKKLEEESIEYFLGPSLMEPDGRQETNTKGFCRTHFEELYNRQENRLGLGLIIETHLRKHNLKVKKMFDKKSKTIEKDSNTPVIKKIANKVKSNKTETQKFVDELMSYFIEMENSCAICSKLKYTMDRYIDVTLYLWFKEEKFRETFNSKKGFCFKHLKQLLEGTQKYLSAKQTAVFVKTLMENHIEDMKRIREEVDWFTKKFDYRFKNESWRNSKDAIPRAIQKITGYSRLK